MNSSSIAFDGTERLSETALQACALGLIIDYPVKRDNLASAGNQIHQPLERRLHRIDILVDVGMIEFDRGKDHRIRKIVQELRSLVEESGVVFIALQNEMFS